MVNTLRRFSKPIMLVITVLVIVSFTFWGPNINPGGSGMTDLQLYGKPVSRAQLEREERRMRIHYQLGGQYAQLLQGAPALSIVFEQEADALGVVATDKQKEQMLSELHAFRDEAGHPNPQKFEEFVKEVMNPAGYARDQIAEFLSNEVRVRRVAEIVGATSGTTPFTVKEYSRRSKLKTEASYVMLKRADFLKDVKVTEEELKKDYENRKEQLKTPALRKVKYAAFLVAEPADGKPLPEDKRDEALQALANKAYDFREALEAKDANFDELAKKFGATVAKTPEFFDASNPPKELENSPSAGKAAFAISKEKPYSEQLSKSQGMTKGAYVLAFDEEKPAEQQSFEAVKQKLETEMKESKAAAEMAKKAAELRTKIEETKKAGKTFYEASESLGHKPVPFPAFGGGSRIPPQTPFTRDIVTAVQKLAPGQLSEPIAPAESKGETLLIVHLDQRTAGEEKATDSEELKMITEGMDGQARQIAFQEWLLSRARAAGLLLTDRQ